MTHIMKKPTKTAAKAVTKPATKRPRTYKKADLPRTARAYLGKKYGIYLLKENEAVARLIELYEDRIKELQAQAMRRAEREIDQQAYIAGQQNYDNPFSTQAGNAYTPTITVNHKELNEANLEAILKDLQPKQLTLREKFLAWIGAR